MKTAKLVLLREAGSLHDQAARYRRLSRAINDADIPPRIIALAEEIEQRARELEAIAVEIEAELKRRRASTRETKAPGPEGRSRTNDAP